MFVLFFLLICLLPCVAMFVLEPSMKTAIPFTILSFALYTWVFRYRKEVSKFSYNCGILLGLAAGLSALSGALFIHKSSLALSSALLVISMTFALIVLLDGPVSARDLKE